MIDTWKLIYTKYNREHEQLRESLCTIGNGYMGTRGAHTESFADGVHYPGTYIAGVYNKLGTKIAGKTIYNEDLVNCPNWLPIRIKLGDGPWIIPADSKKLLEYKQELDMRRGVLRQIFRIKDVQGYIISIVSERFLSMNNPHCAGLSYSFTCENYNGPVHIISELDGSVENKGVARYRQLKSRHLWHVEQGKNGKNEAFLLVKTRPSNIVIAQVSKVRLLEGKKTRAINFSVVSPRKQIIQQCATINVRRNKRYVLEKVVTTYTSRDKNIRNPKRVSLQTSKKTPWYQNLLNAHMREWNALWKLYDIHIDGDDKSQQVLRLHMFHLLQTASVHNRDIDAGLMARGLHGEAYRGHVFWDELFVMPFFDLHQPVISKALLMYRYNRLYVARKYAKKNGYAGAMFPWQSGSTGVEETQIVHLNPLSGKWGPDYSCIQRHVSFAIAYNVWHYWKRSGDIEFLRRSGAEMLLSIAQFAASLVYLNKEDRSYHTSGLMGPDEFHETLPDKRKAGLTDNAYTNILIAWTLMRAKDVIELISPRIKQKLFKKLGIKDSNIELWEEISSRITVIVNNRGIISQFKGYLQLKELDWDAYRKKYKDIHRMDRILKAEGKSPDEYKVAKQADVLMMFYLFSLDEITAIFERLHIAFNYLHLAANYDYYVRRTSHGSTLSKVVHCYVALLLKRKKESWKWYNEVLKSDVNDTQGGTTKEGIHTGVMGGSLYIAMKNFAGIELLNDSIAIAPQLPDQWKKITMPILYQRSLLSVTVTKSNIKVIVKKTEKKNGVRLHICGKTYMLRADQSCRVAY